MSKPKLRDVPPDDRDWPHLPGCLADGPCDCPRLTDERVEELAEGLGEPAGYRTAQALAETVRALRAALAGAGRDLDELRLGGAQLGEEAAARRKAEAAVLRALDKHCEEAYERRRRAAPQGVEAAGASGAYAALSAARADVRAALGEPARPRSVEEEL